MFDPTNHTAAGLDVALERRRERLRTEAATQAATLKSRQVEGVRVVGPWAHVPNTWPKGARVPLSAVVVGA